MTLAPFNPAPRATVWVDADTGHGVDDDGSPVQTTHTGARPALRDVLALAERTRSLRVMLTGARPRAGWLLTKAPGWEHGAHHLDHEAPVGRYTHTGSGARVEVRRAVEWFGAGAYSPAQAREAWAALAFEVASAVPGLRLLASPGATGREAWLRSRSFDKATNTPIDPPQVSAEVAELLRATSGQHRIERFPAPAQGAELGELWLMDGRLMYAACVRELGTGPGRLLTAPQALELLDTEPHARAWVQVRATVPQDWPQEWAGCLPHQAGEDAQLDGWEYPRQAGRTFTTWCDASEVHQARAWEWDVEPLQAIAWDKARPLDTWAARLLRAHDRAGCLTDPTIAKMTRAGLRWMLLHSIGAWHSSGRTETTVTDGPMTRPAGEGWGAPEQLHGRTVWRRRVPLTGRAALMAHPEWSVQVWGRARTRVLWSPTAVRGAFAGALCVPAGQLVSIYGDAVMTSARPSWATPGHDTGKPGQLRVKGHLHHPGRWPTTSGERDQLMHAAEANGATCPDCDQEEPS